LSRRPRGESERENMLIKQQRKKMKDEEQEGMKNILAEVARR
jgi:hypothetical protein